MDEFIAGLQRMHYNTENPEYYERLRDTFITVERYRQVCGIE
jgi:hypothetical protein